MSSTISTPLNLSERSQKDPRDSSWQGFLHAASTLCHSHDENDPFRRFVDSWSARSAVKQGSLHFDEVFDATKPDFLVELLPFHKHADFENAPEEFKQSALSCGWLAYNAKTIAIESKIISPACMCVIDREIPGLSTSIQREAIAQALVDESYHVLLTANASDISRERRGLDHVRLPQFDLVNNMRNAQHEHSEEWKRILVLLATAVVSELLVSDYLKLLSDSDAIQPLNVLTTAIHRKDESAHSGIFKELGAAIYFKLGAREREFFLQSLVLPCKWFASSELDVWQSMLRQIRFPNADRMIADCRAEEQSSAVSLDLSTLQQLYEELHVSDSLRA